MTAQKVASTLLRAKEQLKIRGWDIGGLRKPDGKVCLLGAIAFAEDMMTETTTHYEMNDVYVKLAQHPAVIYLADYLRETCGVTDERPTVAVFVFNDNYAEDVDEVFDALNGAIQKAEAESL